MIVGYAFECQIVGEVPTGRHDRRVYVVVTEAALRRVAESDGV
jgi:5-formyltetrahydrofolate cyclo-ligase